MISSITRDVVITPHLGKVTALVQNTILGLMKTVSPVLSASNPPAKVTAFSTDSKGFSYFDCWVQDARLVVLNAMDAKARGADILTRHKCTGLSCDGKIWNVDYEDLNSGQKKSIKASMVVNATGPWVEKFLKGSDFYTRDKKLPHLKLVKGSHIVVPRKYDGHHSYILQQKDGRIVFAIPFEHNFTLIGTTDENFEGDANDAKISDEEISYLCKAYNEFLKQSI